MNVRNNMSIIKRVFITAGFSMSLVSAFAQQQNQQNQQQNQQQQSQQQDTRPTTVDSIDVIRDYRPILADAVKIRRSPDMSNKREYQPKLSYSIIDKKLDITTGTRRLDIQEMPYVTLDKKVNNYVKIGAGNLNTLLGEVYLTNDEYVDTRFGMLAKVLTQKGGVEDQNFGEQEITLFGRQLYEGFTLSSDVGFRRNNTRFYGYHEYWTPLSIPIPDIEKQAFNNLFLDVELTSNAGPENQSTLSYAVKGNGYMYSDAFDAKENSFTLSAYLNKYVNTFKVGLQASADFTGVKGQSYSMSNHIARIQPFIGFKGENYDLRVGVNLAAEFGDSSRVNLFPDAHLDFALAPSYAHLFLGVNGNVNKTSFRDLSQENPWLDSNIAIANELERIKIYGGIKGNAGAMFGYKAQFQWRKVENLALFDNVPYLPLYYVIYDNADKASSVFNFLGEVNLRVSETVALGGSLLFSEYDVQTQEEAWYKPKVEIRAHSKVNISEKLYLNAELLFMGQSYGKAYEPLNYDLYNLNLLVLPKYEIKTMPAFVDLSAGLEFRATEKLGVSVRVNNLLNTSNDRFLYYPKLGLNVIGGVNFSF